CFHPEASYPAVLAFAGLRPPGPNIPTLSAVFVGARRARGESNFAMKKNIDLRPNLETLFGTRDENLHLLENGLNVTIDLKPNSVQIDGSNEDVARVQQV